MESHYDCHLMRTSNVVTQAALGKSLYLAGDSPIAQSNRLLLEKSATACQQATSPVKQRLAAGTVQ
jgi:hypothetical protein